MSFQVQIKGTDIPVVQAGPGLRDLVDLGTWIAAVKKSPKLEEVSHEDDRPTAIFTGSGGKRGEVIFTMGMIMPVPLHSGDRGLMEELAGHLNELNGQEPNQPSQPTPTSRRG